MKDGLSILNDSTLNFEFGRALHENGDPRKPLTVQFCYFFGSIYCCRLYNKPLTEAEMIANYNATVSYHNILVNGGNAVTSGQTGGENLENIETD